MKVEPEGRVRDVDLGPTQHHETCSHVANANLMPNPDHKVHDEPWHDSLDKMCKLRLPNETLEDIEQGHSHEEDLESHVETVPQTRNHIRQEGCTDLELTSRSGSILELEGDVVLEPVVQLYVPGH